MDPFITQQEIESNKSIFITCRTCGGKFTPFNEDEDTCDHCYNVAQAEKIGEIEIQVRRSWKETLPDHTKIPGSDYWICELSDPERRQPFPVSGKTIPEAIDNYLQAFADYRDISKGYLVWTWRGATQGFKWMQEMDAKFGNDFLKFEY